MRFVIQDIGDGNGLDLLDGDYDAIAMGLTPSELEAELVSRADWGDEVVLPYHGDSDPPVSLDEAIDYLRDRADS